MFGSYAAELLKLRNRGAVWVLGGAGLALSLTFGYLLPYLGYVTGDANPQTQGVTPEQVLAGVLPEAVVANTIGGFAIFAGALALVLGALVVGGEYGWGTLKTLLTQRPGRLTVLGAQLLALATVLAGWVLAIFAACALAGMGIALIEDAPMTWPAAADLATGLAGGWLVLVTWGLAGALLATLFRGVALPIGLGVVWILGVETLLAGVVASVLPDLQVVADALPGVNAGSLVYAVTQAAPGQLPPGVTDAVTGTRAVLTLLCYAAVFIAVTAVTLRRRDVA
ncbi:MAG: ABC transporter permease subunit [Pseudonocardiaceae bacterium]|nr:ABC transporter permease subunit [Pseudonocardiaceae bacterium]